MPRLQTRYEEESISLSKIRDDLIRKYERDYGGKSNHRKLIVIPCRLPDWSGSQSEMNGNFLLMLDGSPPKGYAHYILGHNLLTYISPIGRAWRRYNTRIPELKGKTEAFSYPVENDT